MMMNKRILGLVIGLVITQTAFAQLTGPSTVYTGVNNSYTYTGFAVFPTWQVSSNATIVSTSTTGSGYQATIKFNSGTTGTVTFKDKTITLGTINTTVICVGTPPTLNASREEPGVITLNPGVGLNGTTNKWYNAQSYGTLLHTGTSYSPNLSATNTYWIASVNGSCESSPRVQVTANITPKPVIQSTAQYLNMGSPPTLSVSNNTYTTYSWKRNGIVIGTASTVEANQPGTYTVTVTKTGMTGSGTSNDFVLQRAIDAQPTKNMVITNQVIKDGVSTTTDMENLPVGDRQRSVTYLGGLGNTLQTIVSQGSPLQKDIVLPYKYDEHGRQLITYLPYISTTNDSKYRTNALDNSGYTNSEQYTFYQTTGQKRATDTKPYSTAELEPSPLGRVKSQTGVGNDWYSNNKKASMEYLLNRSTDNIRLWKVNSSGMPVSSSYYGNYQLQIVVSTNENGHKVRMYTDKLGRTIQKQVEKSSGQWLVTTYIYNDLGQLAYVISPQGMVNLPGGTPNDTFLNQWAFRYKYDELGRLVEYRAPGADWLYTVYDKLDRPVLKQDANLRTTASWAFIKYDRNGRAVLTGIKAISGSTRTSVQTGVNSQAHMFEIAENNSTGYTFNRTYPTVAETDLLTVTYYDNYNFVSYTGWDVESHSFSLVQELGHTAYSTRVAGLPTGGKVRMVGIGASTWLNAVQYYDDRYRPIQMLTENQLNGLDRTTIKYNNLKQASETKAVHNGNETVTVVRKMEYDHAGRIEKIYQNINSAGSDQLVAQYEYNELGQLVDKKLHDTGSGNFIQSVDYRYTIRGWLRSINNAQLTIDNDNDDGNDYFGMELLYNTVESGLSNSAQYNGGISAIKYKGPGGESGTAEQRSYKYGYDFANRLLTATSQVYTGSTWTDEANALNENMTYDNNGNILTLSRNQRKHQLSGISASYVSEAIDNLTYTYASGSGNRLTKVEDSSGKAEGFTNGSTATTEYTYNSDGSLTADLNKGISSITYNKLGKGETINFTDGRKIEYTYSAVGQKLTMKLYQGTTLQQTTQYVGGFVYENSSLKFFGSPEGRVVKNGSAFEYQYAIADHQNNTRVVFTSVTPEADDPLATFEGGSGDESGEYEFNTGMIVTFPSANHTPGGSKVIRMNQNNRVGPAKSFKVYPGDEVNAEVWAYYESGSGYGTSSPLVSVIMSAVAGAFGGVSGGGGESGLIYSSVDNAFGAFGLAGNQGDNIPAAYLNYILFDKNYKLLDMGWQPVTSASSWNKAKVSFAPIPIKEEGYMFVYLSYENESNNWVYFDDMKVTHTKSNVIQYNEYYPFGLQASTSWTRENTYGNAYLYNEGSELNSTTGWYEMFYRGYDAALGRMFEVDPFASDFMSLSPYHYVGNNPALLTDPSGGSTPELREFTAMINSPGFWDTWIPGNGIFGHRGPGSGNHWADGIGRFDWSANGGSESYRIEKAMIDRYGGHQAGGNFYNRDGNRIDYSNGQMRVWNPLGGAIAYSESYEKDGKLYVNNYYYGAWEQTQGGSQTWYFMKRREDDGGTHAMVYDPIGGFIYEINQVPGHKWWDQLERLIFNSFPTNNVKAEISVAYQYSRRNKEEWNKLWAREEGNTYLLSPVTVTNPAAATAWFQGQTGNAWNYSLVANNCAHYSVQGLNAGGAGITGPWPHPSAYTMTWTAGQPYPVPIGK